MRQPYVLKAKEVRLKRDFRSRYIGLSFYHSHLHPSLFIYKRSPPVFLYKLHIDFVLFLHQHQYLWKYTYLARKICHFCHIRYKTRSISWECKNMSHHGYQNGLSRFIELCILEKNVFQYGDVCYKTLQHLPCTPPYHIRWYRYKLHHKIQCAYNADTIQWRKIFKVSQQP